MARLKVFPRPAPVVLISGDATIDSALAAGKLGASEFLVKPVSMTDLLDTMSSIVIRNDAYGPAASPVDVVARLIVVVSESPRDVRTLADWANLVAVSGPSIKAHCHRIGITAKQALDLGRLLRVVRAGHGSVADLIESADDRTVASMLGRAGLRATDLRALSPQEFLDRQRLTGQAALIGALSGRMMIR